MIILKIFRAFLYCVSLTCPLKSFGLNFLFWHTVVDTKAIVLDIAVARGSIFTCVFKKGCGKPYSQSALVEGDSTLRTINNGILVCLIT